MALTPEQLREIERVAIRESMDEVAIRDGFASNGSRESIEAGLQAVARAVAADCAITARAMADNESDGYYGQACYEVARMISDEYGVSE